MVGVEEALTWITDWRQWEGVNQKDLRQKGLHDRNAVFIPGEPTIMIKEWPQKKKSRTLPFGCSYRVYLTEVVKDIEMAKALK